MKHNKCYVIKYANKWYVAGKKTFSNALSYVKTFRAKELAVKYAEKLEKKRFLRKSIIPAYWTREIIKVEINELVEQEN